LRYWKIGLLALFLVAIMAYAYAINM